MRRTLKAFFDGIASHNTAFPKKLTNQAKAQILDFNHLPKINEEKSFVQKLSKYIITA